MDIEIINCSFTLIKNISIQIAYSSEFFIDRSITKTQIFIQYEVVFILISVT